MKILTIEETTKQTPPFSGESCTVVLGNFDGVHRGHRCLMEEAIRLKNRLGYPVVVYTFSDYPTHERLTDMTEKAAWLGSLGADYLIFDRLSRVKPYAPAEFVEKILFDRLGAGAFICGFNYGFGINRTGNADTLCRLADEHGVLCTVVPAVLDSSSGNEKQPISSTRIRQAVKIGNMEDANHLLGHPFCLSGKVEHGFSLGRTIGFPTANQIPDPRNLLPKRGVYFSVTKIDRQYYPAVTNIGQRPTVNGDSTISIETHIIGFRGNLYGCRLSVGLLSYHRDEVRFPSKDALCTAIAADCRSCEKFYAEYDTEKLILPNTDE